MNWEKLGSIVKITSGGTPRSNKSEFYDNGTIPWVRTGDLKPRVLFDVPGRITELGLKKSSAKVFPVNTVLVAMYGATIGQSSILGIEAATNQACAAFLPSSKINHEYLYFYLSSIKRELVGKGKGGGQPNISGKILKETKIPLPPLSDQIRIAKLLSRAEGLIEQRKESLLLLDEFVKRVFLDMFGGDVSQNPNNYPETTIGQLAREVKYGTSQSAKGGRYPYLRMNNLTYDGYWDFRKLKYIDINENEVHKYVLRSGDLVFNRTNSKELVGKTGVYESEKEMIIAGYLIRVRFKKETNPWYVWGFLNSHFGKQRLFTLCRNIVGMANINAKELQSLPILLPPIELQDRFATIIRKVQNEKINFRNSLDSLQELFNSLSQRAFQGDLDLSKVPLSETPTSSQEADLPMDSATNLVDFTAESFSWLGRGLKTLVEVLKAEKAGTPLSDEAIRRIKAKFDEKHRPKVKAWVENWMGPLRGKNSFADLLQNFYLKEDEIWGEEEVYYEDVVASLKEFLSGDEYATLRQVFDEESGEIKFILNETPPLKA